VIGGVAHEFLSKASNKSQSIDPPSSDPHTVGEGRANTTQLPATSWNGEGILLNQA